ncbi:MAG TPA: hypothetical protein PKD91_15595, partial [Bacteroidia bacterium]|nr:hypothetical protein [Bacteroidia bacterium]
MNNNRLIAGIFFLASALMACSKDEGQTPSPTPVPVPTGNITAPPANFTKKVLLEYHTAAWCGTCVDAEVKRDLVMNTYPGKVIPVAIHQSDGMQIPLFMTIDATFGSNPAFGMVNRLPSLNTVLLNRTQWLSNASNSISATAKCGLAIKSTLAGSSATVEVQASFRENLTGTYNLT